MRFRLTIALIALSVSLSGCAEQTVRPKDWANMRDQPTRHGQLLRVVRKPDLLAVREERGDWYRVRVVSSGTQGWVKKSLVRPAPTSRANNHGLELFITAVLALIVAVLANIIKRSRERDDVHRVRLEPGSSVALSSTGTHHEGSYPITLRSATLPVVDREPRTEIELGGAAALRGDLVFDRGTIAYGNREKRLGLVARYDPELTSRVEVVDGEDEFMFIIHHRRMLIE